MQKLLQASLFPVLDIYPKCAFSQLCSDTVALFYMGEYLLASSVAFFLSLDEIFHRSHDFSACFLVMDRATLTSNKKHSLNSEIRGVLPGSQPELGF